MRTALVLLFLLAIAAIPGSLIPQTRVSPSEVVAFEKRHPSIAPLFERMGVFHVYTSVWFSAIYLLLMVSLVGCVVPRLRVYLRAVRARPPQAPRNLVRLPAYETWVSDEPAGVLAERAQEVMRSLRARLDVYDEADGAVVAAEKGYLREAGNLLFHFALLVVLAGVALTGMWGFKGGAAVVAGDGFSNTLISYDDFSPGALFDTANLAPFSFRVDDFNVSYDQSGPGRGTPLTFDANLTVQPGFGAVPYPYDLQVNHPLNVDGTQVFLVGHGYAPVVTVKDGDGTVVYSGPVVFLPQDSSLLSFGVVKAPDAKPTQLGFEGYFFPTAGLCQGVPCSTFPDADNPVLSLVAYQGDLGLNSGVPQSVYVLDKTRLKPFATKAGTPKPLVLKPGQTAQLGKGRGSIRFDGFKPWVQLQISRHPWKVIPLVGVGAAILGLLGSLFVRPRRTWIRIRDQGDGHTAVELASLDRVAGGDPAAYVAEVRRRLEPTPVGSEPSGAPGR